MNIRKHIESLGDTNRSLERVIIDIISMLTPWLAPLVPASMVYKNMVSELGFDNWVALIGAAAVEFLGLSAINTAVEFWRYNGDKRYRQSLKKMASRRKNVRFNGAPFWTALFTGAFYIIIVLTINAILDAGKEPTVNTVAKALLSLLSVDAGIIIAVRASHSKKTGKSVKGANGREHERTSANGREQSANTITKEEFVTKWKANGHESVAGLARTLGVNARTAQKWVKIGDNENEHRE